MKTLAAVLGALVVGCAGGRTAPVEAGTLEERVVARAVVEPARGTARVAFPSIARVVEVDVEVGDLVSAGDVLARYERDISIVPEELLAPIGGVVVARRANVGDDVSRSDGAAFEIADATSIRLRIEIEDADVGRAGVGAAVRPVDGETFAPTAIERLTPSMEARAIEPDGELVGVAYAPLAPDARLPLGRTLEVAVALPPREVRARVARDAVVLTGGHAELLVPGSFGPEHRTVELGALDATHVEIVSGVEPGTLVLVPGGA